MVSPKSWATHSSDSKMAFALLIYLCSRMETFHFNFKPLLSNCMAYLSFTKIYQLCLSPIFKRFLFSKLFFLTQFGETFLLHFTSLSILSYFFSERSLPIMSFLFLLIVPFDHKTMIYFWTMCRNFVEGIVSIFTFLSRTILPTFFYQVFLDIYRNLGAPNFFELFFDL